MKVLLTGLNEDTLKGECAEIMSLGVVCPEICSFHLTVSFSGDITELVSAEMLADVFVLVTVLTALPGTEANLLHFANY